MKYLFYLSILLYVSCQSIEKKHVYIDTFDGILIKNYRDSSNRMMLTFLLEKNGLKFKRLSEEFPRCWEYAEIGDSVIKMKDTLILIIKKKDEEKIFHYQY